MIWADAPCDCGAGRRGHACPPHVSEPPVPTALPRVFAVRRDGEWSVTLAQSLQVGHGRASSLPIALELASDDLALMLRTAHFAPVHRCGCGAEHTAAEWARLELVGYQDSLELRNCTCGSTRSIEVRQ